LFEKPVILVKAHQQIILSFLPIAILITERVVLHSVDLSPLVIIRALYLSADNIPSIMQEVTQITAIMPTKWDLSIGES
jgi:hypothetical protein